ncbi:MAG: hypothetical protein OHK0022_19700 [Roseiflexaceae bacterium]
MGDLLQDRCFCLAQHLSTEHGWLLETSDLYTYVARITACVGIDTDISDDLLRIRIINYHNDHQVVEALSDPLHPEYATLWREWTSQVVPALVSSKLGPRATLPQDVVNDMVQEALIDLFRGLAQFNYRSRFSTWVYTVVSHCSTRFGRAIGARKRTAQREAASLEQQLDAGISVPEVLERPDELVEERLLRQLVLEVLSQESDPRLVRIFQLWFDEGQTLRTIGAQLHLSVTRIHTLVEHIRKLLRNDPLLLDWLGRGGMEQDQQPVA